MRGGEGLAGWAPGSSQTWVQALPACSLTRCLAYFNYHLDFPRSNP